MFSWQDWDCAEQLGEVAGVGGAIVLRSVGCGMGVTCVQKQTNKQQPLMTNKARYSYQVNYDPIIYIYCLL